MYHHIEDIATQRHRLVMVELALISDDIAQNEWKPV